MYPDDHLPRQRRGTLELGRAKLLSRLIENHGSHGTTHPSPVPA
jgi:hypothetical protein